MSYNISPGVYSKITDLSEYVQGVPSTQFFIPIVSKFGEDNRLIETNSVDFYLDFGEPDIEYVGKEYGQGPYVVDSALQETDSVYLINVRPNNATYANLCITGTQIVDVDTTAETDVINYESLNTIDDIEEVVNNTANESLCIFYGVGRSECYNDFQLKLSKHANPQLWDPDEGVLPEDAVYLLDIYKKVIDDSETVGYRYDIIGTYSVSFNPNKKDSSMESMFVEDVINRYSRYIKCKANKIKCLKAVKNNCQFDQAFIELQNEDDFDVNTDTGGMSLEHGDSQLFNADGSLKMENGNYILDSLLAKAYSGVLPKTKSGHYVDEVLNADDYYFSVILDGGYSNNVKSAGIYSLVSNRKDCVGIIDNGDNYTYEESLTARKTLNTYNTKYIAMYESYSEIYDKFTGRDIWITPVYHIARIIGYTDRVKEIWEGPAGFENATISNIKQLRFSPRQTQRDQMYLNQINPIVKFNEGYTPFSQLTTQRKASKLQNVNVIRLVLYIQRALSQFCKYYIFKTIDGETFNAISGQINRFLKTIQNKRGLYSFNVNVGSTEYELKAKQIHVNVGLKPTVLAEQILLNFSIE